MNLELLLLTNLQPQKDPTIYILYTFQTVQCIIQWKEKKKEKNGSADPCGTDYFVSTTKNRFVSLSHIWIRIVV